MRDSVIGQLQLSQNNAECFFLFRFARIENLAAILVSLRGLSLSIYKNKLRNHKSFL